MVWRGTRTARHAEQARNRLARLLGEHPTQLSGRTVLVSSSAPPVWPAENAAPAVPASSFSLAPPAAPDTRATTARPMVATRPVASSAHVAGGSQWLIPPSGQEGVPGSAELVSQQEAEQSGEMWSDATPSPRWWQSARLDPGRRGVTAAAAGAAAVLLVLGVLFGVKLWQRDAAETAPVPVPQAAPSESSQRQELVVAVSGKVRKPGLVRLPDGSRVADAVQAAGGPADDAALGNLNLARKIVDGELIVVGGPQPAPAATDAEAGSASPNSASGESPNAPPGVLLDLNSATSAQLDALPGVGPVTAQRILDYRTAHGRFGSVAELQKVDGIGEVRFAKLKPLVTV